MCFWQTLTPILQRWAKLGQENQSRRILATNGWPPGYFFSLTQIWGFRSVGLDAPGLFAQPRQIGDAHDALSNAPLGVDQDREGQATHGVTQGLGELGAAEAGEPNVESYLYFGQKFAHPSPRRRLAHRLHAVVELPG